jgi:hypothetical protein
MCSRFYQNSQNLAFVAEVAQLRGTWTRQLPAGIRHFKGLSFDRSPYSNEVHGTAE